jgi:hypothetical protein
VGSSPENQGNSKLANLEESYPSSEISCDSSLMGRECPLGELAVGSEGLLTDAV